MRIGEFLQNPVFVGYQVNEYYNKTSMEQASIAPRQVEEYFKDVNKIEDYDQIIIDAKKKHIILLISNS